MSSGRLVLNKYSIERFLPFYCALVVYKNIYNYFVYLFPNFESLFVLLYNVVTLLGLVLFVPLAIFVCCNLSKYKKLLPAIIIPLCVIINIAVVICATGDFSILSRQHVLVLAQGTNDVKGYYFSQLNTWFGNMFTVLVIAVFTSKLETVKKCLLYGMSIIFIPAALMVVLHPEFLGVRQSTVEGSDVVFGGGLWNIGVMGIGGLGWLGFMLLNYMNKRQRVFVILAICLFAFLGIAGLSRTLILMLILSCCTYFLIAKKDGRLLTDVLLIFFAVVLFLLVENDIVESIISRFNDSTSGTSNIRWSLWKAYLSHFGEYWLCGAPYGNIYNYYHDVNLHGHNYLPHSAVINFLARFGLLCAISYLVLIKNSFISIRKNELLSKNQIACMRAAFVAYISLAFINQTGFTEPIFYVMFGLWLAFYYIVTNGELKS